MDKEELELLNNVLVNPDGFKLILILLKEFGAFERDIDANSDIKHVFKILGKRQCGLWLLDRCFEANRTKYGELLNEYYK